MTYAGARVPREAASKVVVAALRMHSSPQGATLMSVTSGSSIFVRIDFELGFRMAQEDSTRVWHFQYS